jgi:GNAT superfamily N-acetyltransferase
MDCTIRTARPEDAPALAALSGQLGYPATATQLLSTLRRLETDSGHRILVAELESRPVAWLHAREEWSLESGGRAEIAGLVVEAASRNLGVGARLVSQAEEWACSRGLPSVRVRSRVARADAHRFYRRLGYREVKVQAVLDKPLPPSGTAR